MPTPAATKVRNRALSGRSGSGGVAVSAAPPATGCRAELSSDAAAGWAGRRSAQFGRSFSRWGLQAVPALLLPWRCAVPPACGGLCRPEVGVPSRPRASASLAMRGSARLRRAVPTGGRRSKPSPRFFFLGDARFRPPAAGCADRRSAVSKPSPRFFFLGDTRFRPPAAGCADRRSAFQAVPALLLPWRYAVPPACGGLCRPEVGAPSRPRASSPLAMRGSARLRRAVPTGGRRSKPSPHFCSGGVDGEALNERRQWQRTPFAARVTGGNV